MTPTERDSLLARRVELIDHEFDRLGRAEARIGKAKSAIASAEMTQVYARLNVGRYLIEVKKLLSEFDPDASFEAWCEAHLRRGMRDCYRCMWLAGQDDPERAVWKERAGPGRKFFSQIEPRLTAQEMAADPEVPPLAKHGEIGRGRNRDDNIMSNQQGTSAAYLVRKLKRDAPEFAERLAAGEFRSARAAALAAGIIKPTAAADR
jgi:hypothetical protein